MKMLQETRKVAGEAGNVSFPGQDLLQRSFSGGGPGIRDGACHPCGWEPVIISR